MKAAAYQLSATNTLTDIVTELGQDEDCKVIAGGQSLGAMLNLRLARPSQLFDLASFDELTDIRLTDTHLKVGAMVTHSQIEDLAGNDRLHDYLRFVARGIAYRAVRNCGTLGGSLCHADPAADWVSAMPALYATINIVGPTGQRSVLIRDFVRSAFETVLMPDELVTSIEIPTMAIDAQWSYRKYCRKTGEFALAIVAGVIEPSRQSLRLVFGALDGAPVVAADSTLYQRFTERDDLSDLLAPLAPRLGGHQTNLHQKLLTQVLSDLGVAS